MTQKLAVAIVHGVGSQKATFAKVFTARLKRRFATELAGAVPDPEEQLQVRGVYWADVLTNQEDRLQERFGHTRLNWKESRNVMIDLGGDALAYQLNRQSPPKDPPGTYEQIHMKFAGTLRALVQETSDDAPLCIVAHSLGTVITSNYIWDLQNHQIPHPVQQMMTGTPLEEGRSLTLLYTMGSPIAIWSLRFPDFGVPISFPPPELLEKYKAVPLQWCNLFDGDDVIGYPLKCLNDAYNRSVSGDTQVNVGNLATMWNPASHVGYWKDRAVVDQVAQGLTQVWRAVNVT